MATTTRLALLQLLSEALHDYWSAVTTSAGSGTTILDTKLKRISGGDPDFCIDQWVRNVATGEIATISAYVDATGTITHGSITAVANGATYELHRIDPQLKLDALKRASVLCFPYGIQRGLYLPLTDESLVVDNLLTNPSLDTFSTTFTGWTNIGTPTLDDETTRKVHGTGSASITASGATEGIKQNIFTKINIKEMVGKTLYVRGWVFCNTASSARLRVTFDGSTYANAPYNAGDAEWEGPDVQKIDVAIPADATEATISCEVADGVTAYFDLVTACIDPIHRYAVPSSMIRGPFEVLQQDDESDPSGTYSRIPNYWAPTQGRVLRLMGMGTLEQPTTDAGTVSIGEPHTEYFIAQAVRYVYRSLLGNPASQNVDYLRDELKRWEQEIAVMEQFGRSTMQPSLPAEIPVGTWQTYEDSGTRRLQFTQGR